MEQLQVKTHEREEMVDIANVLKSRIHSNGWTDGALLLFCPHTTGAVTSKMGDMQYPESVFNHARYNKCNLWLHAV